MLRYVKKSPTIKHKVVIQNNDEEKTRCSSQIFNRTNSLDCETIHSEGISGYPSNSDFAYFCSTLATDVDGKYKPISRKSTCSKFHEREVLLTNEKVDKRLGFSICEGKDCNGKSVGTFIKTIVQDGLVAEEGSLKIGDEILRINGTMIENMPHQNVVLLFKSCKGGPIKLLIRRRRRNREKSSTSSCPDRLEVILNKVHGKGLGIGIAAIGSMESKNYCIYVKYIAKPLYIRKERSLQLKDELLAINGQSLKGISLDDTYKLLRALPPGNLKLLVRRPPQSRKSSLDSNLKQYANAVKNQSGKSYFVDQTSFDDKKRTQTNKIDSLITLMSPAIPVVSGDSRKITLQSAISICDSTQTDDDSTSVDSLMSVQTINNVMNRTTTDQKAKANKGGWLRDSNDSSIFSNKRNDSNDEVTYFENESEYSCDITQPKGELYDRVAVQQIGHNESLFVPNVIEDATFHNISIQKNDNLNVTINCSDKDTNSAISTLITLDELELALPSKFDSTGVALPSVTEVPDMFDVYYVQFSKEKYIPINLSIVPITNGICSGYFQCLKESGKSLGVTIIGGVDTSLQKILVKDIESDSPLNRYQVQVKEGDEIIEINKTPVQGLKHTHVLNMLKQSPPLICLTLFRATDGNRVLLNHYHHKDKKGSFHLNTVGQLSSLEDGAITPKNSDIVEIAAFSNRKTSLHGPSYDALSVKTFDKLSPEKRINEIASRSTVMSSCESNDEKKDIKARRRKKSPKINISLGNEIYFEKYSGRNTIDFEITLYKEEGKGLGIAVMGGPSLVIEEGIKVKRLVQESIAGIDGRLQPNDLIVQINQKILKGLTQGEALGLLKNIRSKIVLVVRRARTAAKDSILGDQKKKSIEVTSSSFLSRSKSTLLRRSRSESRLPERPRSESKERISNDTCGRSRSSSRLSRLFRGSSTENMSSNNMDKEYKTRSSFCLSNK